MFMQIHTLTSYHAALLNRDDAGLAKRIPFGNAERMRVSSQCLKRHWRLALNETLSLPSGIRSRHFFEREVFRRVVAEGVDEAAARGLVEKLIGAVIQSKESREKGSLFLKQPVLFGRPEADYFVGLIRECAESEQDPDELLKERMKEHKKNFRALLTAAGGDDLMAGIEGALFGRFVTSDILARTDASVHVAHAFTVHALDNEVDYFTVVDDLKEAGEDAGAAHAGDMELGAGLFYGYVVVDVPLLISNLSGCDRRDWRDQPEAIKDARDVLSGLVKSIATVSPGAKLGATAPYAWTDCALLETGNTQPRSLANAYLNRLRPNGDLMQQAVATLGGYLSQLDGMYGVEGARFISSTRDTDAVPEARRAHLNQTIESALDSVFGGV
ncbi:type I-E CRISPR-associated protein Cas7/Cse4/CasC [Billgrantia desiderata SP1]|uniref:type I-E CRISPR-associated protein Cas7/Cse4/CasC n=1 Tax=Billgrantia desiderata TaxID=52021 RepID=UPI000A3BC227|nr:type I-E CRISPR-associated protein Cas7/Cse4/CasC [Halomonas desiderata]OUE43187.1 type I-E CRISPR-associated protein Cas7/Cse4/CasC [Halomonas desiderata SP1]